MRATKFGSERATKFGSERAVAVFNVHIHGYVSFYQSRNSRNNRNKIVLVNIDLYAPNGISDGLHGFHIHEKPVPDPRPENFNCDVLGPHFNPTNALHGYHAGDLNFNVLFQNNRCVDTFMIDSNTISLLPGPKCIIGRSVVLHEKEDDTGLRNSRNLLLGPKKLIESLKTGNAGKRIDCATII